MKQKKQISVRIDADTFEKFQYMAKADNRAPSGQIKHWIYKGIWDFEKQHGVIKLSDTKDEVLRENNASE